MTRLTLDSNGIFGEFWGNGDVKEVDKFVADCDAFLAALKDSNILTLSLRKTGIGPLTLRKLATSLPAGVTKVDIRHAAIDEEALDAFKGAVPEGCDVVWEPPPDESSDDY